MDGLWATKSEGVGLIVHAISFQDFQPLWFWSTNVTDGQTDDMRSQDRTLHYIVHRAEKSPCSTEANTGIHCLKLIHFNHLTVRSTVWVFTLTYYISPYFVSFYYDSTKNSIMYAAKAYYKVYINTVIEVQIVMTNHKDSSDFSIKCRPISGAQHTKWTNHYFAWSFHLMLMLITCDVSGYSDCNDNLPTISHLSLTVCLQQHVYSVRQFHRLIITISDSCMWLNQYCCMWPLKAKIHYTSFPTVSPLQAGAGKSPLCLLCRVVSQIPLPRLVANLLRSC